MILSVKTIGRCGAACLLIGGSKGGREGRVPPWGSKFFRFHAVFRKIWQLRMLAPPPGELAPPPRGNPGSTTAT